MDNNEVPFTKQMRIATREIHDISDALINAKLGIAMTDDEVWKYGILYFYEVFKYMEEAMTRLEHTLVGDLDIPGIRRVSEFEKDIEYYFGAEWFRNEYRPTESVQEYIDHLAELEKDEPHLLMAFIYHMYMGLFSGGQILHKKRQIEAKLRLRTAQPGQGEAVTNFEGKNVSNIKREMTEMMNKIASQLDEVTRRKLIEESKNVFRMNNKMVKTIPGTTRVIVRKMVKFSLFVIPVIIGMVIAKNRYLA
ncbi:heme oxygenase 1-like isoform X2 [Artemia franciscana]|uniref:Heme oxygenase n=2 Tax=Artemia franciscana TaxID=6661 RepID=A0AA88HYQ3_ARTSF|nr:hypothetical protein QYM36_005632 [Artemia franciscana]KAK2718386.1 hypothetical protein QYM36_005632 [Artemia franciscana]